MESLLAPDLTFATFAVGPSNRLAAAAARRVAEAPGRSYNPLLVHGPAGVGKTHLLAAVARLATGIQPELRVHYEALDRFTDRLTAALTAGTLAGFREAFASLDLLLLDGVELLAGRERTRDEVLRLVPELVRRGAQVVLAGAVTPAGLAALGPRLAGGLSVEIAPLDEETRLALLRRPGAPPLEPALDAALARLPFAAAPELLDAARRVAALGRPVAPDELPALLGVAAAGGDEFASFFSDISAAVAAVVETEPWRRRLAETILHWESEGISTRRLHLALEADSAPDVDELLARLHADVERLRQVEAELRARGAPLPDASLFSDPDRLPEAEALLSREAPAAAPLAALPGTVDAAYLDREKTAWRWVALDERLIEEQG